MTIHKLLYKQDQLPIFQNRMYVSKAEAIECPEADMQLVEYLETGLVYNAKFDSKLMNFDDHYQNEHALGQALKEYLRLVSRLIERSMDRFYLHRYYFDLSSGISANGPRYSIAIYFEEIKKCHLIDLTT